ncbi:hypothetical protein KO465_06390 [Candidatus Micrarchaeota archaeon]|nr:hypothetical protein [Candidatus Micrarchaeota archaeon]
MGTKEDIVKIVKPFVCIALGIITGYMWWMYQNTDDLIMPIIFGLVTMIIAYVISHEKKATGGVIKSIRTVVGALFGLFLAYQIYLYTDDPIYGLGSAIIVVPICVYLISQLDRAGGD